MKITKQYKNLMIDKQILPTAATIVIGEKRDSKKKMSRKWGRRSPSVHYHMQQSKCQTQQDLHGKRHAADDAEGLATIITYIHTYIYIIYITFVLSFLLCQKFLISYEIYWDIHYFRDVGLYMTCSLSFTSQCNFLDHHTYLKTKRL